jgi:replicative DNA helicase
MEHSAPADYSPESHEVFEALIELDRNGAPLEPASLRIELERRGRVEDAPALVFAIQGAGSASFDAPYYARVVRELSNKRRMGAALTEAMHYAGNGLGVDHAQDRTTWTG